jgi:hypothetical protein
MGRQKKPGKREPNGKLSRRSEDKQARRSIDEQAAMSVAKEARQRVHGVAAKDSATELAGTVCGRLLLTGKLTPEQHDAALAYQNTYATYQRAIDAPRPPKAVEIGGSTGGSAHDMTRAQAERAVDRWEKAKAVLGGLDAVQRGTAVAYAACDYIVLQDKELPHLIRHLRLGLDALARHYGLVTREAA